MRGAPCEKQIRRADPVRGRWKPASNAKRSTTVPCLHRFGASMPTVWRRNPTRKPRNLGWNRLRRESRAARMLAPQSRCKHGTPNRKHRPRFQHSERSNHRPLTGSARQPHPARMRRLAKDPPSPHHSTVHAPVPWCLSLVPSCLGVSNLPRRYAGTSDRICSPIVQAAPPFSRYTLR